MSSIPLTQNDIIFAIIGASVLFIIFRFVSVIIRLLVTRTSEMRFNPDQLDQVLLNCYTSFPIENLDFNGRTFARGTPIRITTTRKTTIEGQFIGTNQAELLCLMTDTSIIAQEIGTILEIQAM